jgi:hypothetical protein
VHQKSRMDSDGSKTFARRGVTSWRIHSPTVCCENCCLSLQAGVEVLRGHPLVVRFPEESEILNHSVFYRCVNLPMWNWSSLILVGSTDEIRRVQKLILVEVRFHGRDSKKWCNEISIRDVVPRDDYSRLFRVEVLHGWVLDFETREVETRFHWASGAREVESTFHHSSRVIRGNHHCRRP